MIARNLLVLSVLALVVASSAAFAQEDDDVLAPLTPTEKSAGNKKKKKPIETNKTAIQLELPTPGQNVRAFIDGADAGLVTSDEAPRPVAPGVHKVQVKRPGFKDFNGTVTVRPGAVAHVIVVLEPVSGVLAVQSEPADAEVLVDGARAGVTPLKDALLPPGSHEVTVRRDGFVPSVQKITVSAGKDYELHAQLRPATDRPERAQLEPAAVADRSPVQAPPAETAVASSGPIYTQWYFWTGVGVAAAAATTAVILTSPMGQKRICGGRLCDAVINSPWQVRF